jgi:hypothetical protein
MIPISKIHIVLIIFMHINYTYFYFHFNLNSILLISKLIIHQSKFHHYISDNIFVNKSKKIKFPLKNKKKIFYKNKININNKQIIKIIN